MEESNSGKKPLFSAMVSVSISSVRFICTLVSTRRRERMMENTAKMEMVLMKINFLRRFPITV